MGPFVSSFPLHELRQSFSECGRLTIISALPGDLLEMQIPRLHSRSTEPEILEMGPSKSVLTCPPGNSDPHQS